MINTFCSTPLWKCSRTLSAVATGQLPAETVIRHVHLVNVCTHEIQENIDIAISCGRIALVGDAAHCIGSETIVIDGSGSYAAPGFLDGHIHVESSMMSAGEYARTVIPHGTVGIYMDPHEICNVLGLDGVRDIMEDAARTPLKTMLTTPSCVPSVPGFEDTGACIDDKDIAETMTWDNTVGLGEMMNFPGILSADDQTHAITGETLKAGKIITGHYSLPETGKGLNGYIAAGIRCCHESTRAEDALAKMRLGMYAMLREGSAWRDLHEVAKAVTAHSIDSRFAVLVSDDAHPETLVHEGHLDHILRRAVCEGIDPVTAIQMVTLNCAQCFQMDHELGSITPGKCADIVLLDNLTSLQVLKTLIDGKICGDSGKAVFDMAPYHYPEKATHSLHIKGTITPAAFNIPVAEQYVHHGHVLTHVIEVGSGKVSDIDAHVSLPVSPVDKALSPNNAYHVNADITQDVLKIAVFERHHATGKTGLGFCKGFGITRGAMASTVAHDAHNLLVVGTNDADMALAANTLIDCQGGMVIVADGQVLGLVPLPIAGLMNDAPAEVMAQKVEALKSCWTDIGCTMVSPFMTMALLCLACLPDIRLTNRGLVDCRTFEFIPLFMDRE